MTVESVQNLTALKILVNCARLRLRTWSTRHLLIIWTMKILKTSKNELYERLAFKCYDEKTFEISLHSLHWHYELIINCRLWVKNLLIYRLILLVDLFFFWECYLVCRSCKFLIVNDFRLRFKQKNYVRKNLCFYYLIYLFQWKLYRYIFIIIVTYIVMLAVI